MLTQYAFRGALAALFAVGTLAAGATTASASEDDYTADALIGSSTPWEDFAGWPESRQLALIEELEDEGVPRELERTVPQPGVVTLAASKPYNDLVFGALEIASCIVTVDLASCNKARADATTAQDAAIAKFPSTLQDGPGDAFRHCYWNGLMRNHIGDRGAAMIAANHEAAASSTQIRYTMDTRNNALGRTYAASRTDSQVKSKCTTEAAFGKGLWKIRKLTNGTPYLTQ